MRTIEDFGIQGIPVTSTNSYASSANTIFNARKRFETITQDNIFSFLGTKLPIANLLTTEALYGSIDKDGDYIVYSDGDQNLKKINEKSNKEAIYAQNFVADAFLDLKRYIKNSLILGKIEPISLYSNINAKAGFRSIYDLSNGNFLSVFSIFLQETKNNKILNSKITNHKEFVNEYRIFLEKRINLIPFTFSETVAFYNLVYFCSGMMISISEDDAGDDFKKFVDYMSQEDFGVFLESCRRFGFKVDKNVPWLLIADIQSPGMAPYLQKYNISNADDLFTKRFTKAYTFDLQILKEMFFQAYDLFFTSNDSYEKNPKELCYNENNRSQIILRKKVTRDVFFTEFNDSYWTKLYVYFKNLETKRGLTQQQFENVVREANDAIQNGFEQNALKFINGIFRGFGTINYSNSLQKFQDMINLEDPPVGMLPAERIIF